MRGLRDWTGGLATAAALVLAAQPAAAKAPDKAAGKAAAWAALPDWSGTWQMIGTMEFDTATVSPPKGRAGNAGVRERPPYNAAWEQRYLKNIAVVAAGVFPDPLTLCGIPAGMPRMMNQPDGYEWLITPKQVWEVTENATGLRRIYTDGRPHPANPGHSYTGHGVGHWEGDTLVIDTVGMRGDSLIDRSGILLSDKRRVTERVRKTDADTLEDQITVIDPVALTRPWVVIKRFRRLPKGAYVFDYACSENNRSQVDDTGRTVITDANGAKISD